ncbi:MAG TPA: gamma-glutamyltransferase family protein [Chloroflexia bacterium]|nr:gamma-glutamyltransferase family protein [Chloroflexia bacterium]
MEDVRPGDGVGGTGEEGSGEPTQEQVTRREFVRRAALALGGAVAAGAVFSTLGYDTADAVVDTDAVVGKGPTAAEPGTSASARLHNNTSLAQPAATAPTARPTGTRSNAPASQPAATKAAAPTGTPTPQPVPPAGTLPPMDLSSNPYSRQRQATIARNGVVATSTPLAVEAGLLMLRKGGNAVDAALAAAIAQTVVEPTSNGIGSDAFAMVWDGKKLHGLNGSGRAPRSLTLDLLRRKGYTSIPYRGWSSVTVPGAPALWRDLHARFGKLPFDTLFEPAIEYAERGFRVSPVVAYHWGRSVPIYSPNKGPEYKGWLETYAPGGRAPRAGEVWSSKALGTSLRRIAQSKGDDFYKGELARTMARFSAQTGGFLAEADLAAHTSTWVDPISTTYRGYEVWEMPPNGQGITALIGLNILEGFELDKLARDSTRSFHLQIEALKLAFADAFRYVADPDFVPVPVAGLLDKGYAATRRALIGNRALQPAPGKPNSGGTVYLCAADADGMMVSFIQSSYMGFGSGIVVPGTGIALHDRGANFSLDPNHPNRLAPGKRPYHTIIPGFLTRNGQAVGPFGVMGGFMQPQGHIQVITGTLDHHLNPQAILDAPRWQWTSGKSVQVESDADPAIIKALRGAGHQVSVLQPSGTFGRGQIIWRLPQGGYAAGSDKRADGHAGGM